MAELDVKVSTSKVRELLEKSYTEMDSISESLENVKQAFEFFKNSNVFSGEAADSIKNFIDVVNQDVIDPAVDFNDKMFKALKTVYNEFDSEQFIDLG